MSEADVDSELVKRVQKGDKKAFDMLVVKYQQRIMNLISRFVRDQDEVMDISQEAFIKAYRALPNFRGDSAFYTWLYRIAINTAKNFLVSQGRRPPGSDIDSADAEQYEGGDALRDGGSPERLMFRDEIKSLIFKTIEELPEDLRTAIMLREIDGLSYEEIAESMDCPVGTVRSRIFRARDAIDQKIAPLLEQGWRS
ncbi:RNA polymerase sigma factor RpoE [Kangiella sediminilitoris]|uniref:RNA polymerase sigma factor AlgU n=1 Tax=Kangiella sediminilitoris TaxID=1144748 RepID=A0A1B3BC85_9GAMM|nr:RNA polymerase sigma factor RpoE [Kangiella sediminilitoris]AOE50404.1 RNA polymerase sigma factor AlgU [Kangiella sediminilitoris]